MLLPDRDTVRSRGRRRRRRRDDGDDGDLGEGCSYLVPSKIGSPSRLQDGEAEGKEEEEARLPCICKSSSSSSSTYTRSRRLAALAVLAVSSTSTSTASLHASASPVDVKVVMGESSAGRESKGKGRAALDDVNTHYNDIQQSFNPQQRQPALQQYARLGESDDDLDIDSSRSETSEARRRKRRSSTPSSSRSLQRRDSSTTTPLNKRSNTPEGVPSHYEYIDGQWVPSPDWSLNGLNGARHASNSNTRVEEEDQEGEAGEVEHTTHTQQNVDDSSDELETTTIGWAKSSNAILGVDIDTSLDPSVGGSHTASSISPEGTLGSANLVTRSNMATYTASTPTSTLSATASSSTQASSSSGAGGSTSTSTTNNTNNQQTYDFSRDVPNGWVSDGRTAAYAVPVIIGMSVFLALVIFGLILVLLRMNKSRKKRRKANLNGGLKLSEEGKIPTRPSSPALSRSTTTSRTDGDDDDDHNEGGMSSAVSRRRGGRRSAEHEDQVELNGEEDLKASGIRRRIGRKWTPNLSNGSMLRKRKKKIAQLFRRGDEPIREVIVVDDAEEAEDHTTARDSRESDRNTTSSMRRASISSAAASARDGLSPSDALSRTASNISNTSARVSQTSETAPEDGDRTHIRPPSIRGESANPDSGDVASPSLTAARQAHARNDSIDDGDHHAVPVPSVGPPAYMQPSTPAYSRAPNGEASGSSTSSAHLNAIPASGYLSAVSTPGLMSAGMDEKRALLGGAAGHATGGGAEDAFASQRRFEHLYASREGEDDRLEQMTGAPTFAFASGSSAQTSSSSTGTRPAYSRGPRGHADEESNEAIARRAQQEAIEDHRRELQESLAGHVAVSDKEVLGRLRQAASAPSPVAAAEDASVPSSAPAGSDSAPHLHDASAPTLDEAEEAELQAHLRTQPQASSAAGEPSNGNQSTSILPTPPKAFTAASALHQLPLVDEKTRLRQAEERQFQASSSFSPILEDGIRNGEALSPSAPPLMDGTLAEASAPSAPVFDEENDDVEYVPSAPPLDDSAVAPSAPVYVLEDEEEEERISRSVEDRPYNEGVV
ncbi:hypothetical protein P389DRAFT_193847 [Cystobasidium minutum MCA 4210]|uniref:uncharacterized protein n=1 Tax=Cystobasidium minutum MCA 4210 TaxID=1397322 RepID=UPI0034CDE598|eukprot:jgi/Rhomi1/193847/gm1.2061_g